LARPSSQLSFPTLRVRRALNRRLALRAARPSIDGSPGQWQKSERRAGPPSSEKSSGTARRELGNASWDGQPCHLSLATPSPASPAVLRGQVFHPRHVIWMAAMEVAARVGHLVELNQRTVSKHLFVINKVPSDS